MDFRSPYSIVPVFSSSLIHESKVPGFSFRPYLGPKGLPEPAGLFSLCQRAKTNYKKNRPHVREWISCFIGWLLLAPSSLLSSSLHCSTLQSKRALITKIDANKTGPEVTNLRPGERPNRKKNIRNGALDCSRMTPVVTK